MWRFLKASSEVIAAYILDEQPVHSRDRSTGYRMTEGPNDRVTRQPRQWLERAQLVLGRFRTFALFGLGALVSLLAVVVYSTLAPEAERITIDEVEESVAQALATATAPRSISAQVYQAILPSLVVVQVKVDNGEEEKGFGIGGGVIINSGAAILTSLHVVDNATEIEVSFAEGTRSLATIATTQPENDIAVLVPATPPDVFLPATIGNSQAMRIGDEVFAVGNPLGLAGSMSAGVISGFDRSFVLSDSNQTLEGLIQFDAAVNLGNSGGPLLNRRGQVIGIVTGLINPTDQEVFIGIGFAVPIRVAARAAGGPAQ